MEDGGGLAVFKGIYEHSVDSKNRLIIPAKFRDELGDSFVVTRWLDGCLSVYCEDKWETMIDKLSDLPTEKKAVRQYLRQLTANAIDCSIDNQGRIQLSKHLMQIAGIKKNCVILGVSDHLEIWAEDKWNAYENEAPNSFEDAAEAISDIFD